MLMVVWKVSQFVLLVREGTSNRWEAAGSSSSMTMGFALILTPDTSTDQL